MKILCLIKNLITENQIFGLQIIILLLKLMKETMKIMTQMMKKKEKTCLKSIILKFFDVIPMILILIFFKFLGEINLYISTLREETTENKRNNKAINKVHEDFKKIVAVTKLK